MKLPILALLCLPTVLASLPAAAGGGAPLPHATHDVGTARWLADADVRAMTSTTVGGLVQRAVVTDEAGVPALYLETVDRQSRLDRPRQQVEVLTFRLGSRVLSFRDVATGIEDLAFHRRTLSFATYLEGRREPLRCTLELDGAQALCQGEALAPAPERPPRWPGHPVPAVPQWSAQPSVIQACGNAFYGTQNELACLERVATFAFDPTPSILACDVHAYGDEGALACLGSVAGAVVDPTETIAACDAATYGQESFLACLAKARGFRFAPTATIQACDRAMYGDQATVQCIEAASRYHGDASTAVAACDAAMYGDDAALACVRRGGAY